VPFDIAYIIKQVRDSLKGPCRGHFADKLRYAGYIATLEHSGVEGIDTVLAKIKKLRTVRDSNQNLIAYLDEMLGKIKMFSKMKFAPPVEEEKKEETTAPVELPEGEVMTAETKSELEKQLGEINDNN